MIDVLWEYDPIMLDTQSKISLKYHCNTVANPGVVRLNPPDPKPTLSNNTFQWKIEWFLMWDYIILRALALFITATCTCMIRKLTGSFVVCLVAAWFNSKRDQKMGMSNPKVGMVNEKFHALHAHGKKNPPSQYPASAPVIVVDSLIFLLRWCNGCVWCCWALPEGEQVSGHFGRKRLWLR